MVSRADVREGLELLLRRIDREIVVVESRLQRIARRFGLSGWRELEELFRSGGISTPEVDLLWPEYLYLRERLEELRRRRREVLEGLGRVRG